MNDDQMSGAANKVAGKVEAISGDLLGDAKLQSEGRARRVGGEARQTLGDLKQTVGDSLAALQAQVREAPFVSLLIAGAIGWLIGRVTD